MESHVILTFVLACLVLSAVPGPAMMFVIAHGMAGGRRAGLAAAVGEATGTAVHTVAAALGLSALLKAAPFALDLVRIGGAVFLLYLAVDSLRTAKRINTDMNDDVRNSLGAPDGSLRRTYLSAILNNLANPKVVLFFLAFVPQFITPGGWATSTQILVLGGVLIVIGIIVDCAVGVAAGTSSAILRARPAIQRWLKRISAVIFGGLAVRLLLTDAR
jgi:threonine/homoserine/homoserine lactone efflux protein